MDNTNSSTISSEELTRLYLMQQKETAELSKMVADVLQLHEKSKAELNHAHQQLAEVQGRKVERIIAGGYTIGKIILKIGGKEIGFQVTKLFSVEAAKAASKAVAKGTPFVGLAIGVGACGYRCWKGQYTKGAGELASGFASFIPGIGGLIAFGIDSIMVVHDIHECYGSLDKKVISRGKLTFEEACKALNINNKNPTKEEVDQAYRQATQRIHTDPIEREGVDIVKRNDDLVIFLTECKNFLYSQKGW
jgi:GH24 family phage-related lysozyme (muramidase)